VWFLSSLPLGKKYLAFIGLYTAMPLDGDEMREGPREGSGWWVRSDDRALSMFVAYFPWGVDVWGKMWNTPQIPRVQFLN
jgi:hypothetical protein